VIIEMYHGDAESMINRRTAWAQSAHPTVLPELAWLVSKAAPRSPIVPSARQPEIGLEGLFMDRYGRRNKPVLVPGGITVTA
jgi:hypothetical protein